MASRGRPKKDAPRTPSGQISRALKGEEGLYHPAAIKRLASAATRRMADPQWGTVIGRLYLEQKLTGLQFEAGKRWDILARRYNKAIEAPAPHPKTSAIELSPKAAEPDLDSDEGIRKNQQSISVVDAFRGAHLQLCLIGKLAEKAVRDACEHGVEPVGYDGLRLLQEGLERLGKYWDLAKV